MIAMLLGVLGVVLVVVSLSGRRRVLAARAPGVIRGPRNERVLRRGIVTCRLLGAVFVVLAALSLAGVGPVPGW